MATVKSVGFMNTALVLNYKQAKKLANKIVVNNMTADHYEDQQGLQSNKGSKVEERILTLLPFLEGNVDNFSSLPGSSLDVETKVDIVAKFTDITLGFQIKSSLKGAQVHLTKTCFLAGNKIAPPGVFWLSDENLHPFLILKELSSFLGIPIKQELLDILPVVKQMRGKQIPLAALKWTPMQFHMLKVLALAQIREGVIKF